MSGIWDLLFGEATESGPRKIVQSTEIPKYENEEMMRLNYDGALYPRQYDYNNPPVEPTAYSKKAAERVITQFFGDNPEFPTDDWKKFLDRNKQRISPEDLDEKMREDLLAMRSAVVAESQDHAGSGIRTGKWSAGNTVGESRVDAPAFWAARNADRYGGIEPFTHEGLHQYFRTVPADGFTPLQVEYLRDGGQQHALIDVLGQRLLGFDDYYVSGPTDEKMLDMLERRAEKRIGEKLSKKNQGRISAR